MASGDNIFNQGLSHIEAGAQPTWTPTTTQSKWAKEADLPSLWYWNGSAWVNLNLDFVKTYTGSTLTDNATSLGDQLQALETAIEAITNDGNDTPINRGDAIQDVAPTVGEIPSPLSGDTASIRLTDGVYEKWVYTTVWTKAFSLAANEATNLSVGTATGTTLDVDSSTGTNATLPSATATDAGVMPAADKVKVDFISVTQAVDLDAMEQDIADHQAALGIPDAQQHMGTFTGDIITDNVTVKAAMQELETDLDAVQTLTGVADAATDLGTFTGTTIADNLAIKPALQSLETALEAIDPAVDSVADTNSVDLTLSGTDELTADVKRSATQDNYAVITESADGLRITTQTLTAYASHALADAAVAVGDKYILTTGNIEGVPSDGNSGPIFTRI